MENPVWFVVVVLLAAQLKVFEKFMHWKNKDKDKEVRSYKRKGETEDHYYKRFDDDSRLLHEIDGIIRAYIAEDKLRVMDAQRLNNHFSSLQIKVEKHLEKEAEEDIAMSIMKNDIKHQSERIERTDENMEKVFGMISALKNTLIDMGYGKK